MPEPHEIIEDLLDDIARNFVRMADALWDRGRERWKQGAIDRAEYDEIRDHCRALSRRSMEIVTSSSRRRLEGLQASREALEQITTSLCDSQRAIAKVEAALDVAVMAVQAVTAIVAAVAVPGPATVAPAVGRVTALASAISKAAHAQ